MSLTARERDLILLIKQGKMNREIAKQLGTKVDTVKTQVGWLLVKFKAKNRTHLAAMAVDLETGEISEQRHTERSPED